MRTTTGQTDNWFLMPSEPWRFYQADDFQQINSLLTGLQLVFLCQVQALPLEQTAQHTSYAIRSHTTHPASEIKHYKSCPAFETDLLEH